MVNIQGDQVASLKMVDFNISQKAQNESFTMMAKNGTKMLIAPEMELDQRYNQKIDLCILIWSMEEHILSDLHMSRSEPRCPCWRSRCTRPMLI